MQGKALNQDDLRSLFRQLQADGYRIIGPKVQDDVVTLTELTDFDELPVGILDIQEPGAYRLEETGDKSLFRYRTGPRSPKNALHPPRQHLWTASRKDQDLQFTPAPAGDSRPIAFFGIKSCDLAAIEKLDQVLGEGPAYVQRSAGRLTIVAGCSDPGPLCFCGDMGSGPFADKGYDLILTETQPGGDPVYLTTAGSAAGRSLIAGPGREATPAEVQGESELKAAAAKKAEGQGAMGKAREIGDRLDHPRWQEVADRCLSCANCTMVCPTCFCSTVVDRTDLDGDHSERWLQWDSCFHEDFSYLHGGAVRRSPASRYRQWLTHKLSSWWEQFDSSGCVGCGRCIAWCPVGIDLRDEVLALTASSASASGEEQ